ncbi:hypothetical protein COX69_02465 [Candidatus Falkowbacteria bacterium CG_4_10_14_0_2_um_filter_48_10]|uniref:Nudix hydrolase domain-containing protein n=1 Tax=Candidatus Falkowbacteria bacterium CG23_combo_of_CG06-09_8_20_14_all_49_15 TaxID=1974572 RepID=A0A2G9ZLD9_9BACT|nr:MAG: hypothetical protein COX22_01435 [Candidatus Falkowbacteria bacterium CG23_combo_of_CG06-09_8_20_14_all_49_15]PJA08374.1 MAG: hypothetical protein COX69_02465 [Candidatus Falkowbacteria bacterium CG_4_10_14_0_2_um_filter_48_10]
MKKQPYLEHVVLLLLINLRGQVFLCRKRDEWILPGGHVENFDLDRMQAAQREIKEETELEGIFGQQLLFHYDEQVNSHLRLYDVYAAYYYGDKKPAPLIKEGIVEAAWFAPDEIKKLSHSELTKQALKHLEDNGRSFVSECLHHLQVIANLAQSQGLDHKGAKELMKNMEKTVKTIMGISRQNNCAALVPVQEKNKGAVMIVDDHQAVLSTLREAFISYGYAVYGFSDPLEALAWLKEEPNVRLKAVIADYQMAGLNGQEFLNQAAPLVKEFKKIIISGEDVNAEVKKEFRFFMKPFLPSIILKAVED